ncbi:MAG: hypothetical protein KAU20_05535 [Nanoarchaeota archaeon]|nr:hypothetical protein [Nanoarchaeota archaeon]
MTKKELISRLKQFNDDDFIVISEGETEWRNIENVERMGYNIALIQGTESPIKTYKKGEDKEANAFDNNGNPIRYEIR